MFRPYFAAVAIALSLLSACATTGSPATVADATAGNPQLSTLNKLIADALAGKLIKS